MDNDGLQIHNRGGLIMGFIDRIKKIENLANNGVDGEKDNANAILEVLQSKNKSEEIDCDDIWIVKWSSIDVGSYIHRERRSKAFLGRERAEEFKEKLEEAYCLLKLDYGGLGATIEKQE